MSPDPTSIRLTSKPRWYGSYGRHATGKNGQYLDGGGSALEATGFDAFVETARSTLRHSADQPVVCFGFTVALSFAITFHEDAMPVHQSLELEQDVRYWIDVPDVDRFRLEDVDLLAHAPRRSEQLRADVYREAAIAARAKNFHHVLRCCDGKLEPYNPFTARFIFTDSSGEFTTEELLRVWHLTSMGKPGIPIAALVKSHPSS